MIITMPMPTPNITIVQGSVPPEHRAIPASIERRCAACSDCGCALVAAHAVGPAAAD